MNSRRSSSYSTNMRMPGSTAPKQNRAIFTMVLCLLIPPLGLLFMWRKGVYKLRGRAIVTALATVEMMIIAVMMTPQAAPERILPVPGVPSRVTPAPESSVLTALSNMDEILRQEQEAKNGAAATQGPSAAELLEQEESQRREIMNTVVYCVYGSGVRYYHAAPVCGNQSNRRELTVQEAMSEGLGACPDCNPPVYGFTVASGDDAQ